MNSVESQVKKLQSIGEWFAAVESNNVDAVKASVGKYKGSRTQSGDTALMIAANRGYFVIAKLLHNYEVKLQNNDGLSALMFATLAEKLDIVELLIKEEKDSVTPEGRDALMLGSEAGCSDIVSFLLDHIPVRTDKYSRGALFYAASNLHITTIRTLLESGRIPQSHVRDALTATTDAEVISIISEYLLPDASYTHVSRLSTPGTPHNMSYQIDDKLVPVSKSPSVSVSTVTQSSISESLSKSESISEKSPTISRSASRSSSPLSTSADHTTQADNLTQPSISKSVSTTSSKKNQSTVVEDNESSIDKPVSASVSASTSGSSSISNKSTTAIVSSPVSTSVPADSPSISATISVITKEQDSITSTLPENTSRQIISPPVPRAISATPAILQDEDEQLDTENTEITMLNNALLELKEQLHLKDLQIAELQVDLEDANVKKKMAVDAAALAKEALAAMNEQVSVQQQQQKQQAEQQKQLTESHSAELVAKTEKLERELSIMYKGYSALASSKAEFAEIIETLKRKLSDYEKGAVAGSSLESPGSKENSSILYDLQQQLQCLLSANSQLNELLNDKSNLVDKMSNELSDIMQNHTREVNFYKNRLNILMSQSSGRSTYSEISDQDPCLQENPGSCARIHDTRECDSNNLTIKAYSPSSAIHNGLDQLAALQAELDVMRKVNGSLSAAQANNQVEITRLRMKVDELLDTQNNPLKTIQTIRSPPQMKSNSQDSVNTAAPFSRSSLQTAQLSPAALTEISQLREKVQKKNELLKMLEKISLSGNLERARPILSLLEKNLRSGENTEDTDIIVYLLSLTEENQALREKLALADSSISHKQFDNDLDKGYAGEYQEHSTNAEDDANIEVAMRRATNIKRSLDTVTDMADTIKSSVTKLRAHDTHSLDIRNQHVTLQSPSHIIRSDFTPLMLAIVHKNIDAVKNNIKYAGLACPDGTTALMLAAQYDFVEAIPLLVSTEATMRRRDNATALSIALKMHNLDLAELLRASEGFDVRRLSCVGGRTTELMQAAQKNDIVAVWSFLPIQGGLQDEQGYTALAYAVDAGAVEVAHLLAPIEAQLVDFEGYNVIDRITASTTIPTTVKERLTREVAPYIRADQL